MRNVSGACISGSSWWKPAGKRAEVAKLPGEHLTVLKLPESSVHHDTDLDRNADELIGMWEGVSSGCHVRGAALLGLHGGGRTFWHVCFRQLEVTVSSVLHLCFPTFFLKHKAPSTFIDTGLLAAFPSALARAHAFLCSSYRFRIWCTCFLSFASSDLCSITFVSWFDAISIVQQARGCNAFGLM